RGLIGLDAPTPGLSARESLYLGKMLRNLANQQQDVIASIHQPRAEVLKFFDFILDISKGSTVFFGTREDAVDFFYKYHNSEQDEKEILNQAEFIRNFQSRFFLLLFVYPLLKS